MTNSNLYVWPFSLTLVIVFHIPRCVPVKLILYDLPHMHPLEDFSDNIESISCPEATPPSSIFYFYFFCYTNYIGQVTCLTSQNKSFKHITPVYFGFFFLLLHLPYFSTSHPPSFALLPALLLLNFYYLTHCQIYRGMMSCTESCITMYNQYVRCKFGMVSL